MPPSNTTTTSSTLAPGGFAYWFLLVLGFSTLAPAVLLPEWREYQAIRLAEQVEQGWHDVDVLRQRLDDDALRKLEWKADDPGDVCDLAVEIL